MKRTDFDVIIDTVRNAKPTKMEVIYLMYTMQKALREEDTSNAQLFKYFKERNGK